MFNFNKLKEDEASSALHEDKHPQEQKSVKKTTTMYTGEDFRIARVLLDSSVSVEYPDWIKEDFEDVKTASMRTLRKRIADTWGEN